MLGTIKRPEDIFEPFTADFRGVLGPDLLSICLYGSGASGHYREGKSDINMLLVLSDTGIACLDPLMPATARWRKKNVRCLFMTRDYIRSSIDSYPVEFLNMQLNHMLVYGADPLADLKIGPAYLRLQLERELKGKIFHLRHGYMESGGRGRGLRELIALSLGAFMPLFKALLFLKGSAIPQGRRDVADLLAALYEIDPVVLHKCIDIKEGTGKCDADELKALFISYVKEIEKISACVDCMKI